MNKLFDSGDNIKDLMLLMEFCSALILIFITVIIAIREKKKQKKDIFFYAIFFDVAVSIISDVIANYIRYPLEFGYYSVRFSNHLLFISNYMLTWFVINYIFELLRDKGVEPSKYWIQTNNIICIFAWLIVLSNLFTERLFYFDAENIYYRGDLFMISMICPAIALVVLGCLLFSYRKSLLKSELMIIASYVALPIIAEVVQIFIYGFSWLQLSMIFSSFLLLAEYLISRIDERNAQIKEVAGEGQRVQRQLILIVCVVIIVFFGLIARIAISFASEKINEETMARYRLLGDLTQKEISAWMEKEVQFIEDQKKVIEIFDNYDKEFMAEYFAGIISVHDINNSLHDLYFVSTDNVMSSGAGFKPDASIDFTKRVWYTDALEAEGISFTKPYIDINTGHYVLTICEKVFDKSGQLKGVLALDIEASYLFDITKSQSLPEDSYLFLVDNEMGVNGHCDADFGFVDGAPQRLMTVYPEYAKVEDFIGAEDYTQEVLYLTDYDGVERCLFISKIDACDWYVVAAISDNVIGASRKSLGESIFIALIICLIIGIALTLWGTNNIVKKLADAREEANAANEAKSRFLANMSHEIRTPINAVLGMDEILLRECKDDAIKEYALNIQSAGQALLGVVNDILDFSKIESGKLDIVPVEYKTAELFGGCINLISIRMKEKGLVFKLNQDDYIPKVLLGDEVRIRQIVSNLLTNAVKYTPSGFVKLSVKWNAISAEIGELIISVKDTGTGIKEENLENLFSSFKRIDEKRNRNIEGTGLGLAITKQLVELMNGEIIVNSEYGKGSEFTVKILQKVIVNENCGDFLVKDSSRDEKESLEFTAPTASILIVDDVQINLKVVAGLIKNTNVQIDTAQRGYEAIDMIRKKKYDLVFLDHMMPEMDGIETLKELQISYAECIEGMPIVMLTANAIMGVEEEYLKAGFSDYLSKPVTREEIYKCMLKYLPKEKIVTDSN